jgi:hypothetical protein
MPVLISISEALTRVEDQRLHEFHNLADYAVAFAGFDRKVLKVIGGGSDSVVLRLEDGNVLKITTREIASDIGRRPFDLRMLEQGTCPVDGRRINYFIQPFARRAGPADLHAVGEVISRNGYYFTEPFLNQVGRYQDRPWLLDPWAVTPKRSGG